jgi:hypothetical protein
MGFTTPGYFIHPPGRSLKYVARMAAVVFGFVVSVSSMVAAQGSINGKVVADLPAKPKVLSAVVVSLSSERLSGKKLQSISDEEGRFSFNGLIAGDYLLSVDLAGFNKYEQKISVQIDATVERTSSLATCAGKRDGHREGGSNRCDQDRYRRAGSSHHRGHARCAPD